tara:strand:- start:141 stop:365 length:225 start_codon:yes stop_codon:yes gene_type:complete
LKKTIEKTINLGRFRTEISVKCTVLGGVEAGPEGRVPRAFAEISGDTWSFFTGVAARHASPHRAWRAAIALSRV